VTIRNDATNDMFVAAELSGFGFENRLDAELPVSELVVLLERFATADLSTG
jgi:hypothetical protein